jgi:hypothetical protein
MLRFIKKYAFAFYLGTITAFCGIHFPSWEYCFINFPTILLAIWSGSTKNPEERADTLPSKGIVSCPYHDLNEFCEITNNYCKKKPCLITAQYQQS